MNNGRVGVDDENEVGDDRAKSATIDDVDVIDDGGDGDVGDADDTIVLPWWQHPFNIVVDRRDGGAARRDDRLDDRRLRAATATPEPSTSGSSRTCASTTSRPSR